MVFCSLTCDPHHSAFLSANATIEHQSEETGDNVTLITALNYHISESYVQGLYESCSEVVNPSSNSLALPTFCGSWGEDCNAHRLLDAMGLGADHGGFSPFDIYFDYVTDDQPPSTEFEPFNPVAVACYQPISVSCTLLPFASHSSSVLILFLLKQNTSGTCSCVDCTGSCPKPEPWPPLPEPWFIGSMDGLSFVMLIIFLSFSCIFLLAVTWKWHIERRGKSLSIHPSINWHRLFLTAYTKNHIHSSQRTLYEGGSLVFDCVTRPMTRLYALDLTDVTQINNGHITAHIE